MRTPSRLVLLASLGALVAACSRAPEDPLEAGRTALQNKEAQAAVAFLKNALATPGDHSEARYLLGEALMLQGNAVGAEIEFSKSAELRFNPNKVAPAHAVALLALGRNADVIDAYGQTNLSESAATAELQASLAAAYAGLGRIDDAEQAVSRGLAAQPGHGPTSIMKARIAVERRNPDLALTLLDEVLARDASQSAAWLARAEILDQIKRDPDGALTAYRKAVELRPDLAQAHRRVIGILLAKGQAEDAASYVAKLKTTLRNPFQVNLIDAQFALARGEFQQASTLFEPLVQAAPRDLQILEAAGLTQFRLGNLLRAEELFERAHRLPGAKPTVAAALAEVRLRLGRPDAALEALDADLNRASPLPASLALAGEAMLQLSRPKEAGDLFKRALAQKPDDPGIRSSLAVSDARSAPGQGASAGLLSAAAADTGVAADLEIVARLLAAKKIPEALQAIDALGKKRPNDAGVETLRGTTQLLGQDMDAARKSLEEALRISPGFMPALAALTRVDVGQRRYREAYQRLEGVAIVRPRDGGVRLAMADVLRSAGAPAADVEAELQKAVAASPEQGLPRARLVDHLLSSGDEKRALEAAEAGLAALPDNPRVIHALALARMANKQFIQARSDFNKLASLEPKSLTPVLGLASVFVGLKEFPNAERQLRSALQQRPTLVEAHVALVRLLTGLGQTDKAIEVAAAAKRALPRSPLGDTLEGDIRSAAKDFPGAVLAYQRAHAVARSGSTAIQVHRGLIAAGRAKEASAFAQSWIASHSGDADFLKHLAESARAAKDWASAIDRYKQLLRVQPDNGAALNNLAWTLLKTDSAAALPFAERAVTAMPNSWVAADTLASALAAGGRQAEAIERQKQTVLRWPGIQDAKLNLARLYISAGMKAEARGELEQLLLLGPELRSAQEVRDLVRGLQ